MGGCECPPEQVTRAFERLRAAPFVLDSVVLGYAELSVGFADGTHASSFALLPAIDLEGRLGRELPRAKMLHGRLPDPSAPFEVSIGFLAAERFGLRVGDELRLLNSALGPSPPIAVRVVGVHAAPGELPSASGPQGSSLLLTQAFAGEFPDLVDPVDNTMMLRLRPGTDSEDVTRFIDSLGGNFDVQDSSDLTSGIERTVHIETVALVTLGIIVAAVGIVVAGQMLRRQSMLTYSEQVTYAALGLDGAHFVRLSLLRGVSLALPGGLGAIAIAVALSPLFPVGIGRIADPDVGVHLDPAVVVAGMAATLMVVTALAVLAAAHERRVSRRNAARDRDPVAGWPLPAGPPPLAVGLYLASPGRARDRRSSSRASLVSMVIVVVVVAATAATVASFDHLVRHRELAGATWSAAFLPPDEQDLHRALEQARAVPGVRAATTTGWDTPDGLLVNGRAVDMQVFGDDGEIRPAIRHGRAPAAPGEVALGAKTLAEVGVDVGDTVELSLTAGGPALPGRVVGEVVLASPFFFDFAPGAGAATVASTYVALGVKEDSVTGIVLVDYDQLDKPLGTFDAVEQALGTVASFETADRQGVTGLARVRLVPILLLTGLHLLVLAAVAHVLLVSVSSHRRDVAILRVLGFTARQSWTSVTTEAVLVTLAACAIGVPLGVLIARVAWGPIAASLVVVPRPMTPVFLLASMCMTLLAVALIASLVPAARAVRSRPAVILRTE